jgi:hypothetical protein
MADPSMKYPIIVYLDSESDAERIKFFEKKAAQYKIRKGKTGALREIIDIAIKVESK